MLFLVTAGVEALVRCALLLSFGCSCSLSSLSSLVFMGVTKPADLGIPVCLELMLLIELLLLLSICFVIC